MNKPLLSIVVPTKNRFNYLKYFIDICNRFSEKDYELIIQDNSDDNTEIVNYIKTLDNSLIKYFHNSGSISMSENSNLGIRNSSGEYICFMGDDDLLSEQLIEFVRLMKNNKIEAAIFKCAGYSWPGVTFKYHKFPNLMIHKFNGKVTEVSVKKEYAKLMRKGATKLGKIPQLYHSVVKRDVLDEVFYKTGTYFPGPSPDMAVAIALSMFVKKLVYVDAPLISSGACPKSSAGLGAKHMHKGNIKDISFLPENLEKTWDETIPKIWTGPTIYAVTLFECLKSIGKNNDVKMFNYPYFFAYFDLYNRDYIELSREYRKKYKVNGLLYSLNYILLLGERCLIFLRNICRIRFSLGVRLFDNVNNTLDAEMIIDDELKKRHIEI